MIGDVSYGFKYYGIGGVKKVSNSIYGISTTIGNGLEYGNVIKNIYSNKTIGIEDQRNLFTITAGNIGANIMGTGIGILAAGASIELGPIGMSYFGVLGVTSGSYLGRIMGSYIGGYIFDNFYLPYIYYPLYNINTFNNSLREEIEYNKLFIPNNWSFPY